MHTTCLTVEFMLEMDVGMYMYLYLYDCADRKQIGSVSYIERAKLSYSLHDEPTSWCFRGSRKRKGDVTPLLWKARRICRGFPRKQIERMKREREMQGVAIVGDVYHQV